MEEFDTLEFKDNGIGVGARKLYDNGYGVSVVKGPYSYGGPSGLYELAVLKGPEGEYDLCYDTPITSDVEGYLSEQDVSRLMAAVSQLPAAK